jgi:YcxB-like protein
MSDVSNGTISAGDYGLMSLICFLAPALWLHQDFPRFSLTRRWTIKRAWKQTAQMQLPINLFLTEAGVNYKIQGFEDFRQWQHFTYFRESKELFLLCYSGSLYHIIPKRIFGNLEQMNQFRDLLKENNVMPQRSNKIG